MGLDPQVQEILKEIAERSAGAAPLPLQSPEQIRASDLNFSRLCLNGSPPESVAYTVEHIIDGPGGSLHLRSYHPLGEKPVGVLMYFHGGGFMMGGLDSHDHICRSLANGAKAVVIAVAYRLAPEYKHPAALEDCVAATRWAATSHDLLRAPASRIAVSGDSAGGALAALTAQKLKGELALRFQLLIYPETSASLDWPSVKEFWEPGRMAAGKGMGFFRSQYFQSPEEWILPTAFPDNASDLSGLPPALIITAEIDPMRDMGEAYAKRLQDAGVTSKLTRYAAVTHVFMSMFPRVETGRRALDEAAAAVRAALSNE